MRKRAKVSGARAKTTKAAKSNRHVLAKAAASFQSLPRGEEKEIARLRRELNEVLEQQTATAAFLRSLVARHSIFRKC
jgi:hypothetical protein